MDTDHSTGKRRVIDFFPRSGPEGGERRIEGALKREDMPKTLSSEKGPQSCRPAGQAQRWESVRHASRFAVTSGCRILSTVYCAIALALASSGDLEAQTPESRSATQGIPDSGKPGDYRLIASKDNAVCRAFAKIIATSRSKAGDLDFSKRKERPQWRQPLQGVALDPPMEVAEFDIDNDGKLDRVFRIHWSSANSPTQDLFVQRPPGSTEPLPNDKEAIERLFKSSQQVNLSRGGLDMAALKSRYGDDWEKWLVLGQVLVDVLKLKQKHYVVVWHYEVPADDLASAYVSQVGSDAESQGLCVFARICPCGGCIGRASRVEKDLLPAKLYCQRS